VRSAKSCAACVWRLPASCAGSSPSPTMSTHEALDDLLNSHAFLVLRGMRMLLQKDTELIVDEVSARKVLILDE
jgi:hypothetical protein